MKQWMTLALLIISHSAFGSTVCSINDQADAIAALSHRVQTRMQIIEYQYSGKKVVVSDAMGKRYRGQVALDGDDVLIGGMTVKGMTAQTLKISDVRGVVTMNDYVENYIKLAGTRYRIVAKVRDAEGRSNDYVGNIESRQGDEINIRLSDGSNMLVTVKIDEIADIHFSRRTGSENYAVLKAAYAMGDKAWIHVRMDNGDEFDMHVDSLPQFETNLALTYQKVDGSKQTLYLDGVHSTYIISPPARIVAPKAKPIATKAHVALVGKTTYELGDDHQMPTRTEVETALDSAEAGQKKVSVIYLNSRNQLALHTGYPQKHGGNDYVFSDAPGAEKIGSRPKNISGKIIDPKSIVAIGDADKLPYGIIPRLEKPKLTITNSHGSHSFRKGDEISYVDAKTGERIVGKIVEFENKGGEVKVIVTSGELASRTSGTGATRTRVKTDEVVLTEANMAHVREPDASKVDPNDFVGRTSPGDDGVVSGEITVRRDLAKVELNKGEAFSGLSGDERYVIVPNAIIKRKGRPAIIKAQLQKPNGTMTSITIDLDALADAYRVDYADLASRSAREIAFLDVALRREWFTDADIENVRALLKKLPCAKGGG